MPIPAAFQLLPHPSYSCLLQKHLLHVLEVKPGRAISIIDADVNLEFAPPRHGRSSDSPLSFVFGAVAPPPAKPPAPAVSCS